MARQCRAIPLAWVSKVKLSVFLQIRIGKPPPKLRSQIHRQLTQQLLAISGPLLAALLELDNASADFPIGGRHQGIDGARSGVASRFEQLADAADQHGIGGGCSCRGFRACAPFHGVVSSSLILASAVAIIWLR